MNNRAMPKLLDGWNKPANIITYVRILLAVVFMAIYVAAGVWGFRSVSLRWIAFVLFVLAASTDKIDGYVARTYHQVTELGKLLDPIADKLLILGALIIASAFNEVIWIVTVLFIIREIGITILRLYVIRRGGKVIAASSLGKYKTFTQSFGIGMLLLPMYATCVPNALQWPTWLITYYSFAYALLGVALILALYSGYAYARAAMRALQK